MASRLAKTAALLVVTFQVAATPFSGADAAASGVDTFLSEMRRHESGGDYAAVTSRGTASGAYQFTAQALQDLGMIRDTGGAGFGDDDWNGVVWRENEWGISSREEFLANPQAQDALMAEYTQRNWGYISGDAKAWLGKTVDGVVVDEAAMLAGAHFLGAGGMNQFASCGFSADCLDPAWAAANGMTTEEMAAAVKSRMADFAGADISELTGGSYTPGGGGVYAEGQTGVGPSPDIPPGAQMPSRAVLYQEIPPLQGTLPRT